MARKKKKTKQDQERNKKYTYIFINGKQKKVRKEPTIDGMDIDTYIRNNADPLWLHQNEMWEYIDIEDEYEDEYEDE